MKAITILKLNKSSLSGGIYTELIKYCIEKLLKIVTTLPQRVMNGENAPTEWKIAHKKTNRKKKRGNHRSIAVISTVTKV